MLRASYSIDRVVPDPSKTSSGMVFIVDNDVGMTITNDAENVVIDVLKSYPNHRIIYRDTNHQWDELLHWNGEFVNFKPYSGA